jgi:hypothetical protein
MKPQEIEKEAIALAEHERIDLICRILDTLPAPGTDISGEEAARRDAELDNGDVEELSHDQFLRRVKRERGE